MAKVKAPTTINIIIEEEKQINRIYFSATCSHVEPLTITEDANKVTDLYEELKELRKLKESLSNNKPVCPFCKKRNETSQL